LKTLLCRQVKLRVDCVLQARVTPEVVMAINRSQRESKAPWIAVSISMVTPVNAQYDCGDQTHGLTLQSTGGWTSMFSKRFECSAIRL